MDDFSKTYNVYAVKACTAYNMYTTADYTECYSLPGSGTSLCTLDYNSSVKVLGTYDSAWLLVSANGKTGFVNKENLRSDRDNSIVWEFAITEGSNPVITITAKNYSTHVGKQYELYIAKDAPNAVVSYP